MPQPRALTAAMKANITVMRAHSRGVMDVRMACSRDRDRAAGEATNPPFYRGLAFIRQAGSGDRTRPRTGA
jgi:hypothetical protein